jgi:hypothetical protein
MIDGFDLLIIRPPGRVGMTDARRLSARVREKGAVLVLFGSGPVWPVSLDLHLAVVSSAWIGLGEGSGYLRERRMEVACRGRGAASRERRVLLWWPEPPFRAACPNAKAVNDGPAADPLWLAVAVG